MAIWREAGVFRGLRSLGASWRENRKNTAAIRSLRTGTDNGYAGNPPATNHRDRRNISADGNFHFEDESVR